jgi:hypothetical protein
MIGRPSPKTYPSILNNMYVCAAVDVWTTWERRGWDKGTCAPSKGSLGQMQAHSFRLGEKEGRHSRRITFRRATSTGGPKSYISISRFMAEKGFEVSAAEIRERSF